MSKLMATFGSGGHSTEMLMLLRNARVSDKLLDEANSSISQLVCLISDDDSFTEEKLNKAFRPSDNKTTFIRVRRPRAIKQSYLTSVLTVLSTLWTCIGVIRRTKPALCLTNGPGISVTCAIAIRVIQLFDWTYKCHILYVESFCRTRTLSLTGKIIHSLRLADDMYVQWPDVARKYPRLKYEGILV